MADNIELIKTQGFVDIPFGRLELVYNEAKVHYDNMLIYPPYYSIEFIANPQLNPSDFTNPQYNEWGSFVNIDNEIKYIPDAELIEKLNADFFGLQPVPISIKKSIFKENTSEVDKDKKDSVTKDKANLKKGKEKTIKEKAPKEKHKKIENSENIAFHTEEKVKKDKPSKPPKTKKSKIKEQSNANINIDNSINEQGIKKEKKRKSKTPIFITILLIIVLAGGGYYYQNYINITKEKIVPLNEKLNYQELALVINKNLNQQFQLDTMRYYLIIASKTTKKAAQKESAQYSSLGFSPIILYDSIINRYRVAIDSFSSQDTIIMKTKLEEVRAKYRKDAWILKKRIGDG
jgi:hypothetical protein